MEDDIQDLVDGAEPAEEGVTNQVFFTDKGTVLKIYTRYPITSILESVTGLLNGDINYDSRAERMQNEVEMKRLIRNLGYNVPEVLSKGEEFIEFEEVPGNDGFNFLRSCKPVEAEKVGKKLGEFMADLHQGDTAIKDFKVSNVKVTEDLEIYFIDHEYAELEAGFVLKKIDQLTLFSSVRQTGNFESFLKGFKSSKKDLSFLALLLSIFTSLTDSLVLERDLQRFITSIKSVGKV